MGYTVELWATPPDAVLAALAAPGTAPPDVTMADTTRTAWAELAPVVARAVAAGGGRLVAEYADLVAAVVRSVGHHYGSLEQTSAALLGRSTPASAT